MFVTPSGLRDECPPSGSRKRTVWLPYVAPSTLITGCSLGGGIGVRAVLGGRTPMSILFWSDIPALYLMRIAYCRHSFTAASFSPSFAAIVPLLRVGTCVAVASAVAYADTA